MDQKLSVMNTKCEKYKKVPPEGGWGYIITVAVFLVISLHHGPQGSFGVLFADFLEGVGASTTSVNLVHSLYNIFFSITGLFANILLKKFSCRQVALAGAAIFVTGHFITIFITSIGHLYFTYGILQGIGCGLITPALYTSFNGFFSRKRSTIIFTSAVIVGLSFICYPILIYNSLERYGFRGTLAVLAAINSHMLLAAVSLLASEDHQVYVKINLETEQAVPFVKPEEEKILEKDVNPDNTDFAYEESHQQNLLSKLVDFFDLTLLKDWSYVNLVIGMCFADYGLVSFINLQPLYLFSNGWTKADVAICISIVAVSGTISKICLAILNYFYPMKSRHIFLIGASCTAIGRLCFLSSTSHPVVFSTSAVLGFFMPWMFAVLTLIFAEHVPLQRFPSAYGFFMFSQGVIYMILGPIVGYIRDANGSYVICFHVLTIFLLVCIIPWFSEVIWMKLRRKEHHLRKH